MFNFHATMTAMNERVKQYLYAQKESIGLASFEEVDGYCYTILRTFGEKATQQVNVCYYEDDIAHETRSIDFDAVNIENNRSEEIWYYLPESHELFIMDTELTKNWLKGRKMIAFDFFNKNPEARKTIKIVKKDLS